MSMERKEFPHLLTRAPQGRQLPGSAVSAQQSCGNVLLARCVAKFETQILGRQRPSPQPCTMRCAGPSIRPLARSKHLRPLTPI